MDPLNWLKYEFGGGRDAAEGRLQKDEGTGKYEPNLIQRAFGGDSEYLDSRSNIGELNRYNRSAAGQKAAALGVDVTAADMANKGALGLRVEDAGQSRTLSRQLTALGGNAGEVKDVATLTGMVADQRRSNQRKDTAQIQSDAFNSPQQIEARRVQAEQFNAGRTDVANQMELTRAQMAQSDKNRLAERIDAREARADELMFRRESMERADRKDEKNRRRESIQALVAGLSSLGAAFAV
jgi:hypothetical protein